MFDLAVLPKIRSYYLKRLPSGEYDYEDYKRQCQEFARKLRLPKHQWSLVHIPAYLSLDNARIHVWARKLCFAPRQPDAVLDELLGVRYARAFRLVPPSRYLTRANAFAEEQAEAAVLPQRAARKRQLTMLQRRTEARRTAAQQSDESNFYIMQNSLRTYDQERNARWVQEQLHELSLALPGMICLVPQQVMYLPEVTPDLHCVIEHCVGTVKAYVRERLLDFDVPDADLQRARTYQRWINEAVERKLNGEAGRRHVRRSVAKQKCIAQIVRTPVGEFVDVEYVFGQANQDGGYGERACVHRVAGSGGGWIPDSKWT